MILRFEKTDIKKFIVLSALGLAIQFLTNFIFRIVVGDMPAENVLGFSNLAFLVLLAGAGIFLLKIEGASELVLIVPAALAVVACLDLITAAVTFVLAALYILRRLYRMTKILYTP